jgi:ABC-type phosphate transport system substrate-binding protein
MSEMVAATRTRMVLFVAAVLLASPHASRAASGSYKVVVNAARAESILTRRQVADIFLRRNGQWGDGSQVLVADLSTTSPVRAAFSRDVMGQVVDVEVRYWQQQMMSSRGFPPIVKSEKDVLSFVGTTAGAIGYVSGDTPLPPGLKAVQIAP